MAGCIENLAKFFFILINFLFVLTGIALIALGSYVQVQAKEVLDFLSNQYVNAPIVFIITGIIIFLIASLGCFGVISENTCMTFTYASLLVLVLIVEIGVGISAYVLGGQLEPEIQTKMKEGMINYSKSKYEGVTDAWDSMQSDLMCCGVTSMDDWKNTNLTTFGRIPVSCCKMNRTNNKGEKNKDCSNDPDNVFPGGCFLMMKIYFIANIDKIGGTAIGIAVFQLIGAIVACFFSKRIHDTGKFM